MPHEIFGALAVTAFIISFVSYIRGMILSQVRPHFFTWLIWVVTVSIVFAAQVVTYAGPGAWTTGLSIIFCGSVTIYSLFRGEKNYTRGDWISLIIALMAIPVWYLTKQPAYAALISTGIDCVAYYPTFRKSYLKPFEENVTCYAFDILRHFLSFFALGQVTFTAAIYPLACGIISVAFVSFALWRRYRLSKQ